MSHDEGSTAAGRGLGIRTSGLVHVYHSEGSDVAALSGVDLDVAAGEMVGLLGPSGSGKSTLLSLLAGLFAPSAGKVFVGGHELGALDAGSRDAILARQVALMLQGASRNLLPWARVEQNVDFARRAAPASPWTGPDGLQALLTLVGLDETDRTGQRPVDLTPGRRQLLALAVALASGPGLLLADEPTSQLDHGGRDAVLGALERVNRELGTTVVVVTHDPAVARWMPRTVTIRDGRIGGEGRAGEEFAVVTADGFLPLPVHVREDLPAGSLVRLHRDEDGGFRLTVEES